MIEPDYLIAYIGGAAGRLLCHLVMLSPELHTWNNDIENQLLSIPIDKHATVKFNHILNDIFPPLLKKDLSLWKNFEVAPWHATFEKSRNFVRHTWMREDLQTVQSFGTNKIAFTDYIDTLYFVLKATVEKQAYCLVYHTEANGTGPGLWCKANSEQESILIVKQQLYSALKELTRWQSFGYHSINLKRILFSDDLDFQIEYLNLCEYFGITPQEEVAREVKNHWLSINPFAELSLEVLKSDSELKFYDIAYLAFLLEQQGIVISNDQLTKEGLLSFYEKSITA